MAQEIEHKYLVKTERWNKNLAFKSVNIVQGYLHSDPGKTIRVRTAEGKGYITLKGKTTGATRPEYEYEIPEADANELLGLFCANRIEKTRHYVLHAGKTWEVDEFAGKNKGLMMAEIELGLEDEPYEIPDWVEKNVTEDQRYSNSNLVKRPYTSW